jgi:hypothetical protein
MAIVEIQDVNSEQNEGREQKTDGAGSRAHSRMLAE